MSVKFNVPLQFAQDAAPSVEEHGEANYTIFSPPVDDDDDDWLQFDVIDYVS